MFKSPKVFSAVMNLENDHVIPLLEYVIGTCILGLVHTTMNNVMLCMVHTRAAQELQCKSKDSHKFMFIYFSKILLGTLYTQKLCFNNEFNVNA